MADGRRIITILVVILIVVVVVAGATFWLLPDSPGGSPLSFPTPTSSQPPLFSDAPVVPESGQPFNLNVLQGGLYQSLNHKIITDGALPVQPPAVTGKANPFL